MKSKRLLHVSSVFQNNSTVPYIRISGKWLREAGFDVRDKYEVDVSFGRLTLTNKENDTIDDCLIENGRENNLENIVSHSPYEKKDSYYNKGYTGYTVNLKLERDTNYKPVCLASSYMAYTFLKPLQDESREVMLSVPLDRKNRVLGVYEAGKGGISASVVYPSEIFKPALMFNSSAILLAHNHPSGDPQPSKEDLKLTEELNKASKLLKLQLMDHIIIGHNDYFSLKDNGLIK